MATVKQGKVAQSKEPLLCDFDRMLLLRVVGIVVLMIGIMLVGFEVISRITV